MSAIDRHLAVLGKARIAALAACFALLIGYGDYATGKELSMSLFYLAPVSLAGWYAGRRHGLGIAMLSCLCWYLADTAGGHHYSHPAIALWNALIRFGFFIITNELLSALRNSLHSERQFAQTDVLTGLLSRRAFLDRLTRDLAMARRRNGPISVAYLDLDEFKHVNDSTGHAAGDDVLRAIARVLSESIRQTDSAGRLGGDEFAILLPDTSDAGAAFVLKHLAATLHDLHTVGTLPLTCSIGVVTGQPPHVSLDELIGAADRLMYEVKRSGKGAMQFRRISAGDQRPHG